MSKRRVFELAKEFNTDSKVVLEILKRNNYKVNNNFSGVGEAEYNVVKQLRADNPNMQIVGRGPIPWGHYILYRMRRENGQAAQYQPRIDFCVFSDCTIFYISRARETKSPKRAKHQLP